ncbi:MAG TPA: cyclic nucleotide-binding domain-containing protein [Candidatus Limnocylindrales bacterium]|nr:cyclic nucleotide-binding domain-containing protein [Candidatus Limnocylindrales bacterium]
MDFEAQLSQVPLLADLDPKVRRRLSEQGKRRTYAAGEFVVREGEPASALYIMLRGRVSVEHDRDGQAEVLTEIVPYAFFGEVALLDNTHRTASVRAVEETECLLLLAWEFTALVKENPELAEVVLHELVHRLHRKEHHVL